MQNSQQIINLILTRHNQTLEVVTGKTQTALVSNCRALLYAALLRYSELSLEDVMKMFGKTQNSVSEQVCRITKTQEWREVQKLIKEIK